jgi:ketosteroid isomerase-like protein
MKLSERSVAERLIRQLHSARLAGDLAGMCGVFAGAGRFEILGASADKPIAIRAANLAEFRPWLAMLVKVFRLSNYQLLSLTIEMPRVVAHWRVDIFSKVTGATVPTELVDVVHIEAERIAAYTEFFAPR